MKVLQIIDSLPTGGGARFIVNAVPEFNNQGLQTDVLLLDGTRTDFYEELETKSAGKIFSLTIGKRWNILNIFKIIPYFKKYDLVHVHIFPGSYYVGLAKMLSGSKIPLLFTEHNSQNRRAVHPAFKYIEKIIYSNFTKVVCLTEQVQQFVLKNLNVNPQKLEVIENGIDLNAVETALPYSKKELGFTDDDRLILMAARMEAQKDHETLIQAMANLPKKFKLLLAGDGSKKEELMQMVKNIGAEDRIYFYGNRKDILRILKAVDYSILSSHFEGLSLAALEALASGKPFIASDVEGLDFIKDAGILFEKGNAEDLARIILELENNRNHYNEVAGKCYERSKKYDVSEMVKKYIALYKKVLN